MAISEPGDETTPAVGWINSTRHLFLVAPLAILAWAATKPILDGSFLWHVRAGTLQLDRKQVLTTDPFSIEFVGLEWRTQSWAAEIGYGFLERATGGLRWVPFYIFLVAATAVIFVLRTVHRRTNHLAVAGALAVLMVWQAVAFTSPRPVLFSFLLLAAVVSLLEVRHADWVIPPIIWLWACLHGSFVVGLGLIVLQAIRLRSRKLAQLAGIAAVLATLTAHGWGVWLTLWRFAGNREALALIHEWKPPDFRSPLMAPYAILVLLVVLAATRGGLKVRDLIVVAPFLLFGLLARRNLYPAMIVILPIVAQGLVPQKAEVRRRSPALVVYGFLAVVVAVALVGLLRPASLGERLVPADEAFALLEPGPLFHGAAMGGYLIYAQWPDRQVLFDDRAELFGIDGFTRYVDPSRGDGWDELFTDLSIDQALLKSDWVLREILRTAGWNEVYVDEYHVLSRAP